MNYTGGWWKAVEYDEHFDIRATDVDTISMVGTDLDIAHVFKRKSENNAYLIAAAPRLYEDLKRSLVALESAFQIIGSKDSFFVKHAQGLLVDISQTLAEAEGKS